MVKGTLGTFCRLSRARCSFRGFVRSTSGRSAVEAAFALPVVFAFVFMVIEFGRVLYSKVEFEYAFQNVARLGMVSSTADLATLESSLRNQLILLDPAKLKDVQLTEVVNSDNTKTAKLSAGYEIDFLVPLIAEQSITLKKSALFLRRPS